MIPEARPDRGPPRWASVRGMGFDSPPGGQHGHARHDVRRAAGRAAPRPRRDSALRRL